MERISGLKPLEEETIKWLIKISKNSNYADSVKNILKELLEKKLEEYSEKILDFERKYGMSFTDFNNKWDKDEIENKYSYEVESDFIDWEMLEMEKKEILVLIKTPGERNLTEAIDDFLSHLNKVVSNC